MQFPNFPIEKSFKMGRRNNQRKGSIKQSPDEEISIAETHRENQTKINELHNCMKTFFQQEHNRKAESIFPRIKQIEGEIQDYENSLKEMNTDTLSVENRKNLVEKKNYLIHKIKQMVTNLEAAKTKIQELKFERENLSTEIENKKKILEKLQKFERGESSKSTPKSKYLNILNGEKNKINFQSEKNKTRRRSILFMHEVPQQTAAIKNLLYEEKKQNSSSSYEKWKQIQCLLNLISVDLPTYNLENKLCGDIKIPIGKKIFKENSIDNYFRELLKDSEVKKEIAKLKTFLKVSD